jgi:hypothetical protein
MRCARSGSIGERDALALSDAAATGELALVTSALASA